MRRQASNGRHMRFEILEDRRVLSASLQIDASAYDNAISPDDPGIAKIGYELASIANLASRSELKKLSDTSVLLATTRVSEQRDAILIEAAASGEAAILSKDLSSLGMTSIAMAGRMVSGLLPISAIDALSTLTTLAYARPSYSPMTNVGAADSQGDESQRTDIIREYAGLDGSGISIGIISNSFDYAQTDPNFTVATDLAADILSGDLPGVGNPFGNLTPVNVIDEATFAEAQSFSNANVDEGRAMAQIFHDIAPSAEIQFASGFGGQNAFAANITALANAGADVIVDDLIYLTEPFFQDGIVAQSVNDVVADGVTYISAAGNFARQSYENNYNPHATATGIRGGSLQDFGGGDFTQAITVPVGSLVSFSFQWDEPFFAAGGIGSASNYDILLIGNNGTTVLPQNPNNLAGGQDQTNIGGDALEFMSFLNDGSFDFNNDLVPDTNFNLAFEHVAGPAAGRVKYVYNNAAVAINQFATNSASSFGHANTNGAIAVGAAFYQNTPEFDATLPFDPPVLENFSALGGVDILFDVAGNRLATPEVREGVDIVAPDGVNTTFFGNADPLITGAFEADGLPNFFGTSAAAPHVAGLTALLLQADPSLTPAGIEWALEQSAIDMDNPFTAGFDIGFDDASGYGLVDALGAIGIVQDSPQLVGLDPDEYLVVNDNRDLLDTNADPNIIDVDAVMPGEQVSLRAAVINANAGDTETTLLVQEDTYNLTLTGTGGDTQGDLDITGDVTIVGAGAGLSVIDATNLNDRIFNVSSTDSLDLSRVTLTGGTVIGAVDGGAIYVEDGNLALSGVALVDNSARNGGAINAYGSNAIVTIDRSVFTNNTANGTLGNGQGTGGAIYSSTSISNKISINSSVFANNIALNSPNVRKDNSAVSLGNNLVDHVDDTNPVFKASLGDHIGSAEYVVTSVADTFYDADDAYSLSLREAIDLANQNDGVAEEIWLPAWDFVLTLARDYDTQLTDTNIAFGDLDISDSLVVRGIDAGAGARTTVQWRAGVTDAIFDLLGDFDDDGDVDGFDFTAWQQQNGSGIEGETFETYSADGDDDGNVDGADRDVWDANFGNTLSLSNVMV